MAHNHPSGDPTPSGKDIELTKELLAASCFQARFTKYRPVIEAGYFSDILAPWPSAFRMWTVERLHSKGIRMR